MILRLFAALAALALPAIAQTAAPQQPPVDILFKNVRVFDGTSPELSATENVLIHGNKIAAIGATASSPNATVIDGAGRTLMPGLIDAHTHLMFATVPQIVLISTDIEFVTLAAGKAANDMLMRGYTSARDLGGPVFGLKQAIDVGLVNGPRIWPSGAFISQ